MTIKPPITIPVSDLPFPRLELRWRNTPDEYYNWECDYVLVLAPKHVNDIRSSTYVDDVEEYHTVNVEYLLNTSKRRTEREPYPGDTPYRDGRHAAWDSSTLDVPAYVVYNDEALFLKREERN